MHHWWYSLVFRTYCYNNCISTKTGKVFRYNQNIKICCFSPLQKKAKRQFQNSLLSESGSMSPTSQLSQQRAWQCRYILFCVHFQTNSSLVWKKIQNFDDSFSKPIPVWFGKKLQFWRFVFQTNSSLVWKKWPHFGSKKFQTNNNMDKGIMVSSVCHWLFLFETLLMWLYSMSRLTGRCTMRARMSARGSARCCIERWSWCLWSTWRQYRLLGVIEMVTGRCARLAWGGCGGCWWVVTKE